MNWKANYNNPMRIEANLDECETILTISNPHKIKESNN